MKINQRKVRVFKRRGLRFLRRQKDNPIYIILATILTLFYLFWHLGRYYEFQKYQEKVAELKDYTIETYYFVDPQVVDPYANATSELFVAGRVEVGRGITREGVRQLIIDKVE